MNVVSDYKHFSGIYGVYKLTSPSGKIYIGQSYNIYKRLMAYKSARCKQQRHLYNAIIKYGFENFDIEILFRSNYYNGIIDSLNHAETYFINLYDSINNGYNIRGGGGNNSISEETKLLMSKVALGRKFTPEHKSNLKKAFVGRKMTKEQIEKISKSNMGKKVAIETIQKILNSKNLMCIYKYSLNGKFIKKYESISQAAIEHGIHRASIENCAKRNGTSSGYVWKYEYIGDVIEINSEWLNKKFKKNKRNGSLCRPVLKFDLNGNFVAEFKSVKEAAESVGLKRNSLSLCLNGNSKISAKHKWIYKYIK